VTVPETSSPSGKKRFFRTEIRIEVLSEGKAPDEGWEIHEIVREFQMGDFSGEWEIVEVREISGPECAERLRAQGSEPGFFGLDDDGNPLDENGEEDETSLAGG
jgi:hypothetical protein